MISLGCNYRAKLTITTAKISLAKQELAERDTMIDNEFLHVNKYYGSCQCQSFWLIFKTTLKKKFLTCDIVQSFRDQLEAKLPFKLYKNNIYEL